MLAVHSAHAVPTAAEAQPHRKAGLKKPFDRRIRRGAHEGQSLHENQIWRVSLECSRQETDRLGAVRRVDITVDAEGDGHLIANSALFSRPAGQLYAPPGHIHPVDRTFSTVQELPLVPDRGRHAPRISGNYVTPGFNVPPMDCSYSRCVLNDRTSAPQVLLEFRPDARQIDQFGSDRAIEQYAAIGGDHIGYTRIAGKGLRCVDGHFRLSSAADRRA